MKIKRLTSKVRVYFLLNNGNALRDMVKSEDLTVTILSSSSGHGMQ